MFEHQSVMGAFNHWTRIGNGTVEWNVERNGECTQLLLTHVTGTAASMLNYLLYL